MNFKQVAVVLLIAVASCSGCRTAAARGEPSTPVPIPPEVQKASVEELASLASKGGTTSIPAILRLRDIADARAVPTLENLLAKYVGTGNVTACVAAQALFCTGTGQAHAILSKYLGSPDYSLSDSVHMAFHYRMEPAKRDTFIRQYHLKSTVHDLTAGLEVVPVVAADGQRLRFAMTLKNISSHPVVVAEPAIYPAANLLLEDSGGRFHIGFTNVEYRHVTEYDLLQPAGTLTTTFEAEPMRVSEQMARSLWPYSSVEDHRIFLVSGDYALHLGDAGKFKVRILFHAEGRVSEAMKESSTIPDLWFGTVVSEPVEIEVLPVEKQKPDGQVWSLPHSQVTTTNAITDIAAVRYKEYAALLQEYVTWSPPKNAFDVENPFRAKILAIGKPIVPVIVSVYRDVERQPLPLSVIYVLGEIGSPAAFDLLLKEYRLRPSVRTATSLGACLPSDLDERILKAYPPAEDARLRDLLRDMLGPARWEELKSKVTAEILRYITDRRSEVQKDCQQRSQPLLG